MAQFHDTTRFDLFEKAKTVLRQQISDNGENPDALRKLAEFCRLTGDLTAAAKTYRRLSLETGDAGVVSYLDAVLNENKTPEMSKEIQIVPAPMVRRAGFLNSEDQSSLMQLVMAQEQQFEPLEVSSVMDGKGRHSSRNEALRHQVGLSRVPEATAILKPKVLEILPYLFSQLRIEPFEIDEIKVNLSLTHDGHYGKPHTDTMDGRFKISFLYYFHHVPKKFSGGDLLIYDRNVDDEQEYFPDKFTKIVNEDNLFLAFPCEHYHEITRVACDSKAFEDGRFAASGFIKLRK